MHRMNTALFILLITGAYGCATASSRPFEPTESPTLWEMAGEDGTMPQDEALKYARRLVLDTKFVNRNEACVVSRSQGDLNESRPSSEERAVRTLLLAFVGSAENQAAEFGKLQSRIVWWPSADGESCYTLVCIIPPDTARAKTVFANLPGRRTPLVPEKTPAQPEPEQTIAAKTTETVIAQTETAPAPEPVIPTATPASQPQLTPRVIAKKVPQPTPAPRRSEDRKNPDPQPQPTVPAQKPMLAEKPAPVEPEPAATPPVRHEKTVFEAGQGRESFVYGEGATAKLCSVAVAGIGQGTKQAKRMSRITAASNIIFALGAKGGKEYSYDPVKLLQSTSYQNTRETGNGVEAAVCITLPEGYVPERPLATN